ncbi:hypothetical protein Q5752_002498 [Cryptotrichosporon argae]
MVGSETLENFEMYAASTIGSGFSSEGNLLSGMCGVSMGYDTSSADYEETLIDALYAAGLIQDPLVGFYLTRDDDEADSEITIGDQSGVRVADVMKRAALTIRSYIDQSSANVLSYVTMTSDTGYYSVELGGLVYLADIYGALSSDGTYYSVYDDIDGTRYVIPCDEPEDASTLYFEFNSVTYAMSWADLVGEQITGSDMCLGTLLNDTVIEQYYPNTLILGDNFLHNVYHVVNTQTGDVTLYNLSS